MIYYSSEERNSLLSFPLPPGVYKSRAKSHIKKALELQWVIPLWNHPLGRKPAAAARPQHCPQGFMLSVVLLFIIFPLLQVPVTISVQACGTGIRILARSKLNIGLNCKMQLPKYGIEKSISLHSLWHHCCDHSSLTLQKQQAYKHQKYFICFGKKLE